MFLFKHLACAIVVRHPKFKDKSSSCIPTSACYQKMLSLLPAFLVVQTRNRKRISQKHKQSCRKHWYGWGARSVMIESEFGCIRFTWVDWWRRCWNSGIWRFFHETWKASYQTYFQKRKRPTSYQISEEYSRWGVLRNSRGDSEQRKPWKREWENDRGFASCM